MFNVQNNPDKTTADKPDTYPTTQCVQEVKLIK